MKHNDFSKLSNVEKVKRLVKEGKVKDKVFFYKRTEKTKKELIQSMKRMEALFKTQFGYNLYLTAGTLIGALREKDFIPYDYDVDMAYFSSKTSNKEVKKEFYSITDRLKELKLLKAAFCPGHCHCRAPESSFTIDLWTSYAVKDQYHLIPAIQGDFHKDKVVPLKVLKFRQRKFWIPKDAEYFLDYIYVDWKTPLIEDWRKLKWREFLK